VDGQLSPVDKNRPAVGMDCLSFMKYFRMCFLFFCILYV
jgi:hypothetical protein